MTDEKKIIVTRTIEAPAQDIFNVLTNPAEHVKLDGSGFIRSVDHGDRITATGQKFTMNMSGDHMGGDYQTDNHVTAFDPHKMVGWKTAPAGTEPPGWEWLWELEPQGSDSTLVTHTYDWSGVTDQALLDKVGFPLVKESQLEDSLARLAAAVS